MIVCLFVCLFVVYAICLRVSLLSKQVLDAINVVICCMKSVFNSLHGYYGIWVELCHICVVYWDTNSA